MTKPKSVLAWAVCDPDGVPIPHVCDESEHFCRGYVGSRFNRMANLTVERVRITVVRERKKRRECKCTLAQRLVGDGCDVCNREPKVWKKKATKRMAKR